MIYHSYLKNIKGLYVPTQWFYEATAPDVDAYLRDELPRMGPNWQQINPRDIQIAFIRPEQIRVIQGRYEGEEPITVAFYGKTEQKTK